jgi:hypothetical protein
MFLGVRFRVMPELSREIGSEPDARLFRRTAFLKKARDASRGSPRSFAAQKRLAQNDRSRGLLLIAYCAVSVKLATALPSP